MLRKPLLLALDALGLEAWQMHDGTLIRVAGFAPGEASALQTWLAGRAQRASCRIVVNLADEAYEVEDLPHVRGADRKALVARRTAAWFAHPAFARASSLGPAPDGRKGLERILFAGLERADELRPWLDAVHASGTRITHLIPAANLGDKAQIPRQARDDSQGYGRRWAVRGSNPRHPRCKHGALTN